jgi:hypothetical protein
MQTAASKGVAVLFSAALSVCELRLDRALLHPTVSSWSPQKSPNIVFLLPVRAPNLPKENTMRGLFWIGVVFVVLGIASLVVPLPHNERSGVKVGGASIGIETRHEEKVSPIISAVLIAAGAAMMIAARKAVS